MQLTYFINECKKQTSKSNEDISLIFQNYNSQIIIKAIANKDLTLGNAKLNTRFKVNFQDLYFLNGYQSWTDSFEYSLRKRLRNIKKSPHIITKKFAMDKYGDSSFYHYSIRKSHGYDIFYSKGSLESFIYNLNYEVAYLLIELIKDRRNLYLTSLLEGISLHKGEEITLFNFKYFLTFKDGLENFQKDFPKLNTPKLFGYSSWYNYYQNINEEIIYRDLESIDPRFDLFQIDDGYQNKVGDYLDINKEKFPNGLKPIVDKIHSKGLKAGIWLAPFVAESESKLFAEHPEYFKLDIHGHPLKAGGNWSGFYSLDVQKEEVRNHIKKTLNHFMDLGFDFFKLDFLYACGLGQFEGKSKCQVQSEAYKFLREILKDKIILGCGANIINSYKNFDYLRVGPDVSLIFDDVGYMKLFHRERISTKVTIQNTIYRSLFNDHLFGNDPDVFLLRDENIGLLFEQRKALTKINALFGSLLLTSDNLGTYHEKQKLVLEEAIDIFYHASNVNFHKEGKKIRIAYSLHDKEHEFLYNTTKGVIENER